MKEYYLTVEPTTYEEMSWINLSKAVGKIEFFDTPNGMAFQDILKSNSANIIKIKPYGVGEKDENGNVIKFTLKGFSIGL